MTASDNGTDWNAPCKFGFQQYDMSRDCHEHIGRLEWMMPAGTPCDAVRRHRAETSKAMKLYIAGNNRKRASRLAAELSAQGFVTPCRWWEDLDGYTPQEECEFIANADTFVYLWAADQESARFEAGMAMALRKPIIAVLDREPTWFLTLPNVVVVRSDSDVLAALGMKSYTGLGAVQLPPLRPLEEFFDPSDKGAVK